MEETTTQERKLSILKIGNTDVFLEDFEVGQGKITISNTYGYNYSNFWGSMGGNLKDFISRINADYFADKLMGHHKNSELDVKGTFAAIRKHIREEIGLAWYEHMEFQSDMRSQLRSFQHEMEDNKSEEYFVNAFHSSFIDRLDYWLIDDRYERERVESEFKSIQEHWYFMQTQPNKQYLWLKQLHSDLKNKL